MQRFLLRQVGEQRRVDLVEALQDTKEGDKFVSDRPRREALRSVRTHPVGVRHAALPPDALVEEPFQLPHPQSSRLLHRSTVRLPSGQNVVEVLCADIGAFGAQRRLLATSVVVGSFLRVRERLVRLLQTREVERRLLKTMRVLVYSQGSLDVSQRSTRRGAQRWGGDGPGCHLRASFLKDFWRFGRTNPQSASFCDYADC